MYVTQSKFLAFAINELNSSDNPNDLINIKIKLWNEITFVISNNVLGAFIRKLLKAVISD